ncbi:roadblock/LC7 domain-containing protein (plasmid) [Streptomyces sp. AM 4-1-1]|uniref:roadblock/LC7 domain-containing protein n=1 Tax=Streptomyces sp. AM 4-1-1 TaxID=3028710 RepID=UPI0023B8B8A6|nr:roadblock/LC7 domain-containing protein [Streptomyces sp. AM 4-1-1]WEH37875.1 roadblock/LC7 domain-containing protein [Streptomyces sp. AM 4-1-1]
MSASPDVSWILNDLVNFPGARNAVVLSSDGLTVGSSDQVDRELADRVSAIASGMQSLSQRGAAFVQDEPTPWEQTMVSFTGGFLFILTAAEGAYLVASATSDVDIEAFSYRMRKTIDSLGPALRVAPRHNLASPA